MSDPNVKKLQAEYQEMLDSQQFDESLLDESLRERWIGEMARYSELTNSLITLFDHFRKGHIFVSANHREIVGFESKNPNSDDCVDCDIRIHPDDFYPVMRNGVACMRHFFIGNKHARHHKLVREYRVDIRGAYKRVSEQIQVLETDSAGNIWLAMCLMDISPNQSPPYTVNYKLIDCRTGDIITPVDTCDDGKPLLSEREIEILKLVNAGRLSKEIADMLSISVHTVNTHRQRILEKLQVGTSIEAIKYASAAGLLDD